MTISTLLRSRGNKAIPESCDDFPLTTWNQTGSKHNEESDNTSAGPFLVLFTKLKRKEKAADRSSNQDKTQRIKVEESLAPCIRRFRRGRSVGSEDAEKEKSKTTDGDIDPEAPAPGDGGKVAAKDWTQNGRKTKSSAESTEILWTFLKREQ
ncbi:hypothetical protein HG530_015245 [Fusarium avenaceum]|nr:hypothetical protein HG530_015245 [Fusarium avenaceum]